MNPTSVFNDDRENGFGLGADARKSTITFAQAMEVMRVLNNLGIYGDVYVNQEHMGAQIVPVTELNPGPSEELVYVVFYNGDYHELAEMAVALDKNPKTEVVKRIAVSLQLPYNWYMNIPSVMKAASDALNKLF